MKHPSAAFVLLVVGLLLSYSWYWFPADIQGWVQNISSALTALFLLVVIGMLFGSAEVWGVVALLSLFKATIVTCNVWWLISPWPIQPGKATCSAKFDMPLGIIGLTLGAILIAYFLVRRHHG